MNFRKWFKGLLIRLESVVKENRDAQLASNEDKL